MVELRELRNFHRNGSQLDSHGNELHNVQYHFDQHLSEFNMVVVLSWPVLLECCKKTFLASS